MLWLISIIIVKLYFVKHGLSGSIKQKMRYHKSVSIIAAPKQLCMDILKSGIVCISK